MTALVSTQKSRDECSFGTVLCLRLTTLSLPSRAFVLGGCDGCIDPTDADNRGLEEAIDAISYITDKYNDSYSRADVWALATLVSADLAITGGRPDGLHFPMRYIGRKDCSGADSKGLGGPEVKMPSNDFTTHELLEFFREYFGFDTEEVVVIMGEPSKEKAKFEPLN